MGQAREAEQQIRQLLAAEAGQHGQACLDHAFHPHARLGGGSSAGQDRMGEWGRQRGGWRWRRGLEEQGAEAGQRPHADGEVLGGGPPEHGLHSSHPACKRTQQAAACARAIAAHARAPAHMCVRHKRHWDAGEPGPVMGWCEPSPVLTCQLRESVAGGGILPRVLPTRDKTCVSPASAAEVGTRASSPGGCRQ